MTNAIGASIQTLTFGIEIETVGLNREATARAVASVFDGRVAFAGGYYDKYTAEMPDGRKWVAMSDASISGTHAEIVSPICSYQDLETVQDIVRAVRRAGGRVNHQCGIHVHIGAERFKADPKALVRLTKITRKHEDVIFEMLQTAQNRKNQWCKPISDNFYNKIASYRGNSLDALNRAWYNRNSTTHCPSHYDNSRYYALNLHNVWFRGTVEFRWFEATLHAGKVKAYVQLCLGLAAKALDTKGASGKKRPFEAYRGRWDARTLMIRLGLIGDEFKTARLHLTRHLQGDSRKCPAAPTAMASL